MLKRYIGDRAFYRRVLAVAVPIMIQSSITSFVSLLDNIMVGQVGTLQMSGVSIVNQLLMIFNLCMFGAVSGAGIYASQFYGSGDQTGVRYTFRFKLTVSLLLLVLGLGVLAVFGPQFIGLYLQGEQNGENASLTLGFGREYLNVMLIGLIPFALSNVYSSTLRETGKTTVPMVAGITAVFVNLILNYILILGKFGAPALGSKGAAIATVVARFTELAIVAGWTHLKSHDHAYIRGAYRSLRVPMDLTKGIIVRGMPLLLNEFFWAVGMAWINQCYSTRGLDAIAAQNIASTLIGFTSVAFAAMGNAVGILMGQMLGAGASEGEIRSENRKLIATSVFSGVLFACVALVFSGVFPDFYNTSEEIRILATHLIWVYAACMPLEAFNHSAFYTLRSGGEGMIVFLFDSIYAWVFAVPTALLASRFTDLSIVPLYLVCQIPLLARLTMGVVLIKKGSWIRNLVKKES